MVSRVYLTVALSSLLFGEYIPAYPEAISVVAGGSITSEGSKLENSIVSGVRYTENIYHTGFISADAYQLGLDYISDANYIDSDEITNIARLSANLIWNIDIKSKKIVPFVLIGAGASYFSNPETPHSAVSLFTNVGGGVEYNIDDNIAVVSEMKYIYEDPQRTYMNANIGLKYGFGN
jgi:opacity protein-like surface antigen